MLFCGDIWVEIFTYIVEVSQDTEHFKSAQAFFGDGHEMTGHLMVTLGGKTLHDHC